MPNNHFTATNLAVSDLVNDSPTNNFCTLNTISGPPRGEVTFSEGNLKATGGYDASAAYYPRIMGTMAASSGKWFYEARVNTTIGPHPTAHYEIGFKGVNTTWPDGGHGLAGASATWATESEIALSQYQQGIKSCDSTTADTTDLGDYGTAGIVVGIGIDLDASPREMRVWKEGTEYNSADLPTGGSDAFHPCIDLTSLDDTGSLTVNFGQDATFVGTESGTTYTTDAGGGDTGGEFTMQPPAGYKAWTTKNLTASIAKPSEHFNTVLYTGNDSTNARTGVGFQPDLLWVKARNDTRSHNLVDSVRGFNGTSARYLMSNDYEVEAESAYINSLDSDGFTVSGSEAYINSSSNTYVAWNWKGGTTLTQSGTHTYELQLEVTDSGGDGWGDWGSFTTPRLQVWEGATSLGYASHLYDGDTTQYYTINTNNKDAIKIVWDYDSSDGGTLDQQGATLKDGSTVIQTAWTTSDTVVDGEVWITQSTSTNESTVGTLSTGAPASYPSSNYNAAAGFSIAKWTGDDVDTSGSGQTVNHNLGVAPEMIIAKNRTSTASGNGDWMVYHKDVTSGSYMRLNTSDAETAEYTNTMQSITSVKVDFYSDTGAMNYLNYGGDSYGTASAEDYIAYMFASVEGYSKVGSYTGNGSADGPFVYFGFRPSFLIVKRAGGSGHWYMYDSTRSPYNELDLSLKADSSGTETTYGSLDLLSNGFKWRMTDSARNGSGETYIYVAFAESPFKYANAR